MTHKFSYVENPTGTIHGDLNIKLGKDLASAIKRYFELSNKFDIGRQLSISGMFSIYATILASFKISHDIPPEVFDTFLTEIRKDYDLHCRRGQG